MSGEGVFWILFILFWGLCWAYWLRLCIRTLQKKCRISFYITDIWAAMLALAPSYFIIQAFRLRSVHHREIQLIVFLILFILSQCLGIVMGRLISVPRELDRMPARSRQAVWILAGGLLIGPFILLLSVSLFSVSIFCPPLGIALLLLFHLRKTKNEGMLKPPLT
jgi:hypothetical protein